MMGTENLAGAAPAMEPEVPKPGPSAASSPTTAPETSGPGNVQKIRDILFGSQMRDYEARFARLEETLAKESADLRQDTRRRFDALEGFVKAELDKLGGRIRSERDERGDSHSQISRDLREAADMLLRKIREVEDRAAEAQRDIRQEILQQSKELNNEIHSRHQTISATVDKRVQELRKDKTDRASLATLLTEMAMRLNDEFHIPEGDN